MSTQYKNGAEVPSETLCARLKELSKIIPQGREAVRDEFTMRIPAEVDRDADIVIAEAASRIVKFEAENARLREALELIMPPLMNQNFPGSTELKKAAHIWNSLPRKALAMEGN